jgi:hypothetical protein
MKVLYGLTLFMLFHLDWIILYSHNRFNTFIDEMMYECIYVCIYV